MKTPTDKAIEDKFQSLLEMGLATLQRCGWDGREFQTFPNLLEYQRLLTQAANLIERVCGRRGAHYEAINQLVPHHQRASNLPKVIGILKAAQADYADGFLAELRYLVRADLIEDFLTQAQALFQNGYHAAGASLAGTVLEDTLRKLCDKHSIPYDRAKTSIEALNMELGRAAAYDKLVQKEITAKAHLRNEADHGRFANVKSPDVEDMLRWVGRFAAEHLKSTALI